MKEEEYNFIKRFVDKRIRDRMIMEYENDIEMRHGKEYIPQSVQIQSDSAL